MKRKNKTWYQYMKYCQELKKISQDGLKNGAIEPWSPSVIHSLNSKYKNGIPGSIILLLKKLCSGGCFDNALLLATAIDIDNQSFQIVDAIINEFLLRPNSPFSEHRFIEYYEDNEVWIYDTSSIGMPAGYRMKKSLYYKLQNPQICQKIDSAFFQRSNAYPHFFYRRQSEFKKENHLAIPYIDLIKDTVPEIHRQQFNEQLSSFKEEIGYTPPENPVKKLIMTNLSYQYWNKTKK